MNSLLYYVSLTVLRTCAFLTAHQILANDLNMNRVCARWLPQILTAEHLTKRVELSKQFIKKVNRGGIRFLDRIITKVIIMFITLE
jgi:hypothetical protein